LKLTLEIQRAQRNIEEWEALAAAIQDRLESIQEAVRDKHPSDSLQNAVTKYSKYVFSPFKANAVDKRMLSGL
jgi:hypothetical protein